MDLFRILFLLRAARFRTIPGIPSKCQALTVREIGDRLNESRRSTIGERVADNTVRRWLNQLHDEGGHVQRLLGSDGSHYWALDADSPIHDVRFNEMDAVTALIAYKQLQAIVPPVMRGLLEDRKRDAERLLEKMAGLGNKTTKMPLERLTILRRGSIEPPPSVSAYVVQEIYDALKSGWTLWVRYHSLYDKIQRRPPVEFVTSPIRLVQHGDGRLYLLVPRIPELRHDPESKALFHSLALHRILKARCGEPRSRLDPEVEAAAMAMTGFGERGCINFAAQVADDLAIRLEESPINESQRISSSSSTELPKHLTVTLDWSWELEWWILSNGPGIVVLAPPELRKCIVERLNKAVARYGVIPSA